MRRLFFTSFAGACLWGVYSFHSHIMMVILLAYVGYNAFSEAMGTATPIPPRGTP